MNKKVNIDYKRIPHYIFIAAIVIALLILNYLYFSNHISSNSEVINNYSLRDEDMNTTRVPAVAGLFYPADHYQLEKDVDGYLHTAVPHRWLQAHIKSCCLFRMKSAG